MKSSRIKCTVRGFTIVETLVAISILLIGVSAAFSAAQSSLSATSAIKDRITAIFLAQEAMEMARNLKDQNLLAQNISGNESDPEWLEGFSGLGGAEPCSSATEADGFQGGTKCDYSFNTDGNTDLSFIECELSGCEPLNVLDVNGNSFYTHDPGTPSRFTREIYVKEFNVGSGGRREAQVAVTVTWPPNHEFSITNSFFNWFSPL